MYINEITTLTRTIGKPCQMLLRADAHNENNIKRNAISKKRSLNPNTSHIIITPLLLVLNVMSWHSVHKV